MKKFFSIFCALAIVLSVTAAPVSKKDFADKKVVKKEIRAFDGVKKAPAKAAAFKSMKATTKVTFKDNKKAAKDLKAVSVAKAPKAKKETIDLTFTSADAEVDWNDQCADAGWWQIQAETDEYYVTLSNLSAEEAAGEYAWEDLDPDYCAIWYEGASDLLAFTDGSCTVAVDETDGLKVTVEGSFVCEDGNTYNLHIEFAKEAIVAEDIEFVAVSESHSFYASGNDVYFTFRDADENVIHFDIVVAEGLEDVEEGKEYTLADMLESYSNVTYNEEKADFVEASFVKIPLNGGEKYEATAVDTYGRKFHLAYTFIEPVAERFETITAEVTLTKETILFWTQYIFAGADEANAIVLELLPDESIYGTWEAGKDITGAVTPLNGLKSEIYSGEVTIAATAEGFKITGKVLCFNNTEYTLDLTYVIPDATRQADFTLANLEANVFDGGWQLSGFNADSTEYITIAALSEEVSGNYTEANLYADYCYIYTGLEFDEEGYLAAGTQFTLLKADLNVTYNEADSTMTITGKFRAQNADDATDIPEFTLALSGRVPTPEVSDMTFEFADEEEGIRVTPSNDDDAWDWYVVDEAMFEYYGAEYIAEAIYGNYGNTYAVTGEQLLSFEGDLANYLTASGTFYLVVWGAGEREITTEAFVHEFEYESGLPEGCTQYDAEDDFEVDFADFNIYADEEEEGVWWIVAQGEEGEYLQIAIVAPELVAGEYPVLEESEEPYAVAGGLDLSSSQIFGSFVGYLNGQYISVPLWALTEGTVTLNENETIDVDAVNCQGAKIVCHLGEAQAINNTDAAIKAAKVVRNGQLIIIKNGVEYNAQGAVVK